MPTDPVTPGVTEPDSGHRPAAGNHNQKENHVRKLIANYARLRTTAGDAGMSTVEYAVGTLAAAILAGVLIKIVGGDHVNAALTALLDRALN